MNIPTIEVFQQIYNALTDDTSKMIYRHRLLYSLLGERNEITSLANAVLPADASLNTAKICYYGAGEGGWWFVRHDRNVPFVIDKYKTGLLNGVPVISFGEFLKMSDRTEYLIIVTVSKPGIRNEIVEELKQYGLHYVLGYPGVQYFDLPELDLRNEYFADVGAKDGETTKYMLDYFENGYAYVFEPNPKQFEITQKRLKTYSQTQLFPYGLYNENATMLFDSREDSVGSSKLSETGSTAVEVRKLDDLLGEQKVTYIKMDIEGSELAALQGTEQIIRTQRPKLAICVYHKPEDMWEIPYFILKCCPNYNLYLRQYSLIDIETVLYAI